MLKFFSKNNNNNMEQHDFQKITPEELKEFKFNTWIPEGIGDLYDGNMDKLFFSKVTLKYFLEYIKPNDKVLDVGAGTGRLSLALAEIGCDVTAIDISESMLKKLDEKKGDKKIKTVVANCENLGFEDSSFDSVVSLDAMIHFPNWQDFLSEQVRIVKKNGIIAFNFYSGDNFNVIENNRNKASSYLTGGHFYANATKDELYEICKKYNLELVKLQPFNFFHQNVFSYGYLTSEEQINFNALLRKMLHSHKIMDLIVQLEEKIVKNMSNEDCSNMLVVLRKK